jgi:photosystem II stability/assembly factor-like uncharacterized protein
MKNHCLLRAGLLLLTFFFAIALNAQSIVQLQQGKPTSIRGLSVVDDSVAWMSGSKGYIAITKNGGKNWDWQQVKGFEKADFRDIEAFSDKEAIIMSSGTPALVLKTIDGGASWQVKYNNADTSYFFDAMDFANPKHGLILGDPIKNEFVMLETVDGGETWKPFDNPPNALPGEAAFAASGTCLRYDNFAISIVTGGSHSREVQCYSATYPHTWVYNETSIKHGKQSQGAFSLSDTYGLIVVGGDYQNDRSTDSVAEYVFYNGKEFSPENGTFLSKTPPSGYQSCVEFITGETYLSTGTPGSNITTDGGKTWKNIDATSYNVCRKAKHGKLVLLAGNAGKIGILHL